MGVHWAAARFPPLGGEIELLAASGHDGPQPPLDNGPHLLDPVQVRMLASLFRLVKDLVAVNVNLQAAASGWGQFYGNITRVVGPPKFRRQPRGDRVVTSRDAIDDLDFYFAKFSVGHTRLQLYGS